MNILVTGANGQLGNEMRIVAQSSTDKYIFTDVNQVDGLETTYLDITDLEAVREMVKEQDVDAIINCAAWTNVDGAEDPEKYALVEKLNATAPENLAKAMKEVGGWLVQISTDYVFGKEPYNTPCREEQEGTPTGVYGATKLLGEQKIIETYRPSKSPLKGDFAIRTEVPHTESSPTESPCAESPAIGSSPFKGDRRGSGGAAGGYLIIRTAWLYSEFGKNFCKTMLNLTATKPQLKVVFDQAGTPTYAWDLAVAIEKALTTCLKAEKPDAYSGIYHFSNEGVCSWYDFTKMIQQIALEVGYYEHTTQHHPPLRGTGEGLEGLGLCDIQPCHSDEFPSPVTRPAYSVLDKTKIKETFGVHVPYWTDSLKRCIKNLQEWK